MLIKLERYFDDVDLKKQTPNQSMQWGEFTFTEQNVDQCDYLVILEYPKNDFSIKVNPNNIIHICMEPPNEVSKYRQYANKKVNLILNQIDIQKNNQLSHGALPWFVGKDYDFLNQLNPTTLNKKNTIVWVTSNQKSSKGHCQRMDFLDRIKELPFVKLYGRGIQPIEDKWEVLSQSKYALAYENYENDYYWTEKIADCFLSYTMPLYFGCSNIANFFPEKSFIQIDPKDKHINLFLKEIVNSNSWEENLEAITKARNLILNQYQLFPFLANQIQAIESKKGKYTSDFKEKIDFKGKDLYFDNYPLKVALQKHSLKLTKKIVSKFKGKP